MAKTEHARPRFKIPHDAPRVAIGLPVRKTSPIEFWISMMQVLPPLNVKLSYIIQKGADVSNIVAFENKTDAMRAVAQALRETAPDVDVCRACSGSGLVRVTNQGKLPAEARNEILKKALADGVQYVWFVDDDVLFPDMALYRLWVAAQKHPEAACITGIYPTKADPCEPLLYASEEGGAYWDWPLGALVPIHSAGAGCMLVNLAYVQKLEPPWFNDVVVDHPTTTDEYRRQTWGHDRFFHNRLRDEAGGVIYADTGVLCGHWDVEHQRNYVIPPDAPCFQRPPAGESFVPFLDEQGVLSFRRLMPPPAGDPRFMSYLDYVSRLSQTSTGAVERQNLVEGVAG